jgi:hypothetical protein
MNTLRSVISWVLLYLVAPLYFLTASVFVINHIASDSNVKQVLKDKNVYGSIVPSVLSTANYNNDGGSQLPLKDQWVKDAANKAFPASDLQQKGSTVVDSTFAWLDGKTAIPEFSLDFSSNKLALSNEVGNYAQTRLAGLPRCTTFDIPASVDAFSITCLPFGANPALIANSVKSDIANNQNFLKNSTVSTNDISTSDLSRADGLRASYQNRHFLLWLLPLTTLLCGAGGIVLARGSWPKAMRRLARSLILSAFGLTIFAFVISSGLEGVINTVSKDEITRNVIGPVFIELGHQARTIYLIFAGIALVIGLILFVVQNRLKITKGKPGISRG